MSLPLSIGLGVVALAPLGPEYTGFGMMAGLHAAAFLSLIAVVAGARGVAIYAPRSLVSFSIAAVLGSTIAGAGWLPKNDPASVMSATFLMLALVGVFQLVFALFRLARLVKYLPAPVMAGFQNAAAIAIALSQLPALIGATDVPHTVGWLPMIAEARILPVLLGLATLLLIFYTRRVTKRIPPLVMGLLGGTAAYYVLSFIGLSDSLGGTLERISAGLPSGHELAGVMAVTQLPGFVGAAPDLLLGAFSIAVVASLDVLVGAKVVENMSRQRGNSTRELLCIGGSNVLTPLLGGIVGSISLAPTTTNFRSGASNSLSLLTHGILFLVVIVFLAPLIQFLPKVVMAALVLYTGLQLFDRWTLRLIVRIIKRQSVNWAGILVDLGVIGTVVLVTLSGRMAIAVGLGILISVVIFTIRMSQGVIRRVRFGDEVQSRRSRTAVDAETLLRHGRRIVSVELEGPIFFASAEQLQNRIDSALAAGSEYIILEMSRVTEVDSTGANLLSQSAQRIQDQGAHLLVAGLGHSSKSAVIMRDHGASDIITGERHFPDLDRALEWCENQLLIKVRLAEMVDGDYPLDQLELFLRLDEESRQQIMLLLERCEFSAGQTIFQQGERGDSMYVILRGSASVRISTLDGDRRLVTFSPGTMFGEMSLLDDETRSATLTADEAMVCLVLTRAAFDTLAVRDPKTTQILLVNLARELSQRLRAANRLLRESA